MKSRHYIIYIPGLGDHYDAGRGAALWCWQIFQVKVQLVPMQWNTPGGYEQKVKQLKDAIKTAQDAGYTVSLVGESAGASMALNVAATTPGIHCIVTLAGVNSSDLPISPVTRRRSPAFAASAARIKKSLPLLDTSRVHTFRALIDETVWTRYDDIPGATAHRLLTVGHLPTIILCLTLLSPYVISIIKRRHGK